MTCDWSSPLGPQCAKNLVYVACVAPMPRGMLGAQMAVMDDYLHDYHANWRARAVTAVSPALLLAWHIINQHRLLVE